MTELMHLAGLQYTDVSCMVSVVIPCYNSVRLRETLESVCRQSYSNWEVLCIDDCSETDVSSIVESVGDSRIFYYRLERHSNANVARNYGINRSCGKYIAMLDSDDEWLENHLETSLAILQKDGIDGVYGSLILRGQSDKVFSTRALRAGETIIDFLLTTGYGAQTSTLVMTATSVKDILWDESLKRHQDYDFVVRYGRKYRLFPKLEPTVVYHVSNTPKVIDFDSCIRFIHTVEDEITDYIYMNYHRRMLRLAMLRGASEDVVWHYRKAATHYKYLLSFYDYLLLLQPRRKMKVMYLMMKYIWEVFRYAM